MRFKLVLLWLSRNRGRNSFEFDTDEDVSQVLDYVDYVFYFGHLVYQGKVSMRDEVGFAVKLYGLSNSMRPLMMVILFSFKRLITLSLLLLTLPRLCKFLVRMAIFGTIELLKIHLIDKVEQILQVKGGSVTQLTGWHAREKTDHLAQKQHFAVGLHDELVWLTLVVVAWHAQGLSEAQVGFLVLLELVVDCATVEKEGYDLVYLLLLLEASVHGYFVLEVIVAPSD
jgi:hypothetical protein